MSEIRADSQQPNATVSSSAKRAGAMLYFADAQHHVITKVTPIQSRTLDSRRRLTRDSFELTFFDPVETSVHLLDEKTRYRFHPRLHIYLEPGLDVSVRPEALVLATSVLERETYDQIQEDFADHHVYGGGDDLDTSTDPEQLINLVTYAASVMEDITAKLFDVPVGTVHNWSESDWQQHFVELDERRIEDYLLETQHLIQEYLLTQKEKSDFFPYPMSAIGNHDGAGYGNNLILPLLWITYVIRIQFYKNEVGILYQKVTDITDRLNTEKDPVEVEKLKTKLQRIQRRIAIIEGKLPELIKEKEKAEKRFYSNARKGQSLNLSRFLVNRFFGMTVDSPQGYWALNAGGPQYMHDVEDRLFSYLSILYPEIDLKRSLPFSKLGETPHNHRVLEPLVTRLQFNTLDNDPDTLDYRVVNSKRDPVTGKFLLDKESGHYIEEESKSAVLDDGVDRNVPEHFNNFWKEIRPGEYLCLVDYPNVGEENPSQHYIMIQAVDQGVTEDGKRIFNIIMDGMDHTEEDVELAYWGVMSQVQRRLCQSFIDFMRQKTGGNAVFAHSSHSSLDDHSKSNWKKYGWPEYFAQDDVLPFFLDAHGHMRKVRNEAVVSLCGKEVYFGKQTVDSKLPFWGLMTPSMTDDPNEFMTVELHYDAARDCYVLGQKYHPVLAEEDIAISADDTEAKIDFDVVQEVESLRDDYFRQHRYWEYSNLKTGLFSSIQNMLFSSDRVLAFDSIPMSRGRFEEALVFTDAYLKFLKMDFGEFDAAEIGSLQDEAAQGRARLTAILIRYGVDANFDDPEEMNERIKFILEDPENLFHSALKAEIESDYLRMRDRELRIQGMIHMKCVAETLEQLETHMRLWLYGDPDADTKYDSKEYGELFVLAKKKGYLATKAETETMKREKDKIAALMAFDDVFDTPAYKKLRILIAATPKRTRFRDERDSKSYQFWLLLGRRAAQEEKKPLNEDLRRREERNAVPNASTFEFKK